MRTESARRRVARGATLLDQIDPEWAEMIDLDSLDLHNGCDCILGQRYDFYTTGLRQLFARDSPKTEDYLRIQGRRHGFAALDPTSRRQWKQLTQLWKAEILKRLQIPIPDPITSEITPCHATSSA
jgi:hypothetical protein